MTKAPPVVLDFAAPLGLSEFSGLSGVLGVSCRTRPSGDDVAVPKRERIDQDVLDRRAQVAVLSGLAVGDDVYDLMADAAGALAGTVACILWGIISPSPRDGL